MGQAARREWVSPGPSWVDVADYSGLYIRINKPTLTGLAVRVER